jgi:magnesium transporter
MFKIDKFFHRPEVKIGQPPGTPVYAGKKREESIHILLIDYNGERVQEKEISKAEECCELKETPSILWITIDGIHDVEIVGSIARQFGLHPLVVEDILHPGQRPKMEDFEGFIYLVFNMLSYDEQLHDIKGEQVSLVLTKHAVLCFQERPGDIFDPVRERIRNGKGRIRRMGTDYLAYSLLDTVVDNYFIILEKVGERIEELEESVINNPMPESMQEIHRLKREMLFLRKSVWPLREMISSLEKTESELIHKSTLNYLRDLYDHTIQVIDTVETFRDMLSGLHDTFLTTISNRMNEIMKVLTIIATIFIPLTFVAGIYGMNFEFMPELKWRWGYFAVLLVLAILAASMVYLFRRKKWF